MAIIVSPKLSVTPNVTTVSSISLGSGAALLQALAVANASFIKTNSAFGVSNSSSAYANASYIKANSAFNSGNTIAEYANASFIKANSAFNSGNTIAEYANAAFIAANTGSGVTAAGAYGNAAFITANSAFNSSNLVEIYATTILNTAINAGQYANAAFLEANSVFDSSNTIAVYANSSFVAANSAFNSSNTIAVYANNAFLKSNSAFNSSNTIAVYANSAFVTANSGFNAGNTTAVYANSAFLAANSASIYANAAFLQANTPSHVANSAANYANNAFTKSNSAFAVANSGSTYANSALAVANSASAYANSGFFVANSGSSYANSAFAVANSGSLYANSAFVRANNSINANTGGTITGDLRISGNLTVTGQTSYVNTSTVLIADNIITLNAAINQASAPTSDAGIEIDRGSSPNVFILWNETTDAWQFTNDGTNYENLGGGSSGIYANSAFVRANNSINANTGGVITGNLTVTANIIVGNSIIGNSNTITLGSNTTGTLVSNAVTLTTGTSVTNGLALLNQVLGKLVPSAPPTFPGSTGGITIKNLETFRMANFTQTDNTTSARNVAGGTTVSTIRRGSSYQTSNVTVVGPGDSGTLSTVKNSVTTGSRALTTGNDSGTYSDLIILNDVDYGTISGGAQGFWQSINANSAGTVSAGWNEVFMNHTSGTPTSTAFWYYDNGAPGAPQFTNLSCNVTAASIVYANSSTIRHYANPTAFNVGFAINRLSGDVYPTSDSFITGTAGGAFNSPSSVTYATAGVTTPLARNLYVASGSAVVNTSATVITGFGSSSTGPSVSSNNSYQLASQSFTTPLGNTILYKTGTTSSNTRIEETNVFFGSTVGSGTGLAFRIVNPGSTDNPSYSASASAFDSTTGTLQTYDATVVAAVLKHDQINYSTGYLPVGPDLSSGRSAPQYFTFKFIRTSVSKFDIQFSGNTAGVWIALPGSTIDSTSSLNGWLSMTTAYAGSGIPGVNSPGNGSNGCALGGIVTANTVVTNHRKTCTFGTVSSSDTVTNEIYVRIKLLPGQTITALSLQSPSN